MEPRRRPFLLVAALVLALPAARARAQACQFYVAPPPAGSDANPVGVGSEEDGSPY